MNFTIFLYNLLMQGKHLLFFLVLSLVSENGTLVQFIVIAALPGHYRSITAALPQHYVRAS